MNKRLLSILLCASILGGAIPFSAPLASAANDAIDNSYANDLYEPTTSLAQAPIVMQNATSALHDITALEKRPSALIFEVRMNGNTLYAYEGNTAIAPFGDVYYTNQPKTNVGARIALGDQDAAAALAAYVAETGADNLWVISPDVTVLNTVTTAAPLVRGVIDFTQESVYAPADVAWSINTQDYTELSKQTYTLRHFTTGIDDLTREQIYDIFYSNGSGYTTALLPEKDASAELISILSAMGIYTIVETNATDKAGFYDVILTGANGILSSDYAANIATLEDTALFPANTPTLVRPAVLVAHRGDPMYRNGWFENSLPALISAAESGATMLEFDVYMTTDKKLVLMHDEYTGTKYTYPSDCPLDEQTQIANAAKPIYKRAWSGDLEYVRWTAGDGVTNGPINQLHELYEAIDTEYPDMYMYLEMKSSDSYEAYNRVISLINRYGLRHRTTLISFNPITTDYGHTMGIAAKQLNTYGVTPGTGDIKSIITNLKNQRSNIFEQSLTAYTADTTSLQSRLRHYGFFSVVGGIGSATDSFATTFTDGVNRLTMDVPHRSDIEVKRLIAGYDTTTGKVSASYEHYRHKSDGIFDETSQTENVYHYWIEHGYASTATTSPIADANFEIVTIAGNPAVDNSNKTVTGTTGDVIAIRYRKMAITGSSSANPKYYYTYSPAIRLGVAVDKGSLQSTISSAQALSAKKDNYTTLSWKLMSDALNEATVINNATNVTQATVDAVQSSLRRRINELVYEDGVTVDVIAYVDAANPSATPTINDIDNPYATISAAITALDKLTGNVNRIVKVKGAYTCASGVESFAGGQWLGFAAHTNLITIESATPNDATALLNLSNVCTAGGPIKFDNVHYLFSDNTQAFRADGHAVEFGNNAISHYTKGTHGRLYTGAYAPGAYNAFHSDEARHSLTINGQSFSIVGLGDASPRNGNAYNIPGVDFVMNGGNIDYLSIGNYDAGYKGYNHFTDNVNLTINGGTIANYWLPKTGAILADGKALQIIVNNGGTLNWYYNNATQITAPSITDTAGNNALYVLKAEQNSFGATLATTDKVGVYTAHFNGNGTAIATATAEDGTVYTSEDGTLKLKKPGVYTVTWKVEFKGDVIAYVDAANPSATPAINDIDNPYATISAAITALDALTGNINRIVKVNGAYTCVSGVESFAGGSWAGFAKHSNLITIESATPNDATALLNLSNVCTAGGPIKFDNVHYLFSDNTQAFRADGHAVEFGNNAISHYTKGTHGRLYTGAYAPGAYNAFHSDEARHSLTINGQSFSTVGLGDASPRNSKAYPVPGVDFVMNDGTITDLLIGNYDSNYKGYNHFTDTVNLTINGGTIARYQLPKTGAILDSGKALQIIVNNGGALNWYYDGAAQSTAPTVTDKAGNNALYVLQAEANALGGALAITDTVGVYAVSGAATAIATAEDGTVYTSKNGTLTVPAGIYTVSWKAPALVHGAQARDGANNHLRFIATAAVSGVTFRNDGSANYSNATITLNGQTFSVLDVGMLVSLSRSSADDLSFATDGSTLSGVKKVAAQRLQSNAFAIEKGYRNEDEDFILFTAVVLNIPEAYVESAITARAYVAYTDADGNTAYLYSDCVSRSYRMVAPIE